MTKKIKEIYQGLKDQDLGLFGKVLVSPLIVATLAVGFMSVEQTSYMQSLRKEREERKEFVETFQTKINDNTKYSPLTHNILGVDFEGDGELDAIITYASGSTRGVWGNDIKPVNN